MNKYIALLRGINVSGKNKIAMADLKSAFENIGFGEVKTYLNSGNVIFTSNKEDEGKITSEIKVMISEKFSIDISIYVTSTEKLRDIIEHAPSWWGTDDKEIYDNIIFLIAPTQFREVYDAIGDPKEDLERIENYQDVIFWSFSRKDYQKTNWWSKTASAEIGIKMTIRTANTVKRLLKL